MLKNKKEVINLTILLTILNVNGLNSPMKDKVPKDQKKEQDTTIRCLLDIF